jgi:antitoxin ParD1/3/4
MLQIEVRGVIMARNTSISLGDHFVSFIEQQVHNGCYGSASDVVRAGLRLLEEHEAKMQALRNALVEGENSGIPSSINEKDFLKAMQTKHVR